jgi:hypothetical protein
MEDSVERCVEHLFHWQHSNSDSFSAKLFELIMKADSTNRNRLALAFPHHFAAWHAWWLSDDSDRYFAKWGLQRPGLDLDNLAKGNVSDAQD